VSMPLDVTILVVTAVVAVIAVVAAVVAVRALREVRQLGREHAVESAAQPATAELEPITVQTVEPRPVQVIESRVVATLTRQDLLEARLSRPMARLAVYAHGVAHALRPESRDRITALVRREYRRRRALRLKIARRALRSVPDEAFVQRADWLGSDTPSRQLPRAVGE